ncbi:MAG: type I phosphomannose isomerase catalytic subunit [Planctomycetota bacterium]
MPADYPLRFEPLFRRYLWGGRRLQSVLGKPIGAGEDYAESWEIVDHGADQSVVAAGDLAGRSLHELVKGCGNELFGRHHPQTQFPLLFKFLDAHRNLSVQVHPNDEQAQRLDPPDLGKTEAWVVVHAEPGSLVYAGLKRGFDRQAFEREVNRGTTELCLHRFEPRASDCIFIPAGTVHALGAGLIIAEIQQASDTTFRVSDWNRVGSDGQPRPLHIEQALEVIDYAAGPVAASEPQPTDRSHVSRLVACDKFVLDRWQFDSPQKIGGDDRFHILAVLAGAVRVSGDRSGEPLTKGQTMLLPAAAGECELTAATQTAILDMYLP